MRGKTTAWLQLFRAVNLPTVPGDILAGAAIASIYFDGPAPIREISAASAASVLLYMFGLADNDIVGAATDTDRPIPLGLVSMRAARIARAICLLGAVGVGLSAALPQPWWPIAFILAVAIVVYNRTKAAILMGFCRGLNLLLGTATVEICLAPWDGLAIHPLVYAAAAVWTLYIAAVTKYSEGEEADSARKRRVGILIGALVWLQLAATLLPAAICGEFHYAAAQAAMIALLFLLKRLMPKVSAS